MKPSTSNLVHLHAAPNATEPLLPSDLPSAVDFALASLLDIPHTGAFLSRKAAKRNQEKQCTAITAFLTRFEAQHPGTVNHLTNTILIDGYQITASARFSKNDAFPDYTDAYVQVHIYSPDYLAYRDAFLQNLQESREVAVEIHTAYSHAIAYPYTAYTSNYDALEVAFVEASPAARQEIIDDLAAIEALQAQLTAARAAFFSKNGLAYTTNLP